MVVGKHGIQTFKVVVIVVVVVPISAHPLLFWDKSKYSEMSIMNSTYVTLAI